MTLRFTEIMLYPNPTFVSSVGIVVVNFWFKRYLRSLWTDWLQILCEASWCGSLGNNDFWSVIDISDRTDQMFKRYLLWSLWTDWLKIVHEAFGVGLPKLWKLLFLFSYRRIRHSNRPDVQTLSSLKFMGRLALYFSEASWCGSLPKLWKVLFLVCYYRRIRHSNRLDFPIF